MGTLTLKYINQHTTSVGKFLYYTTGYSGYIEAHNGCYENAWCGNRCNNVDINDMSGIGQMTNPNRFCVGETSCLREPSSAQCWSTKDKCYVRRWSLAPSNYSEIYNFDSVSHTFELESNFTSNNVSSIKRFNVSYLAVNNNNPFTFQLEGSYNPTYQVPIPSIGLMKVIFGATFYGPYSPVNSPLLGSLGELQTTTLSQLACPSDGSAINVRKASGIFTWTGRSTGSFASPATSRALSFPYISAGYTWNLIASNSILTNPSVVSPLAVVIKTSVPINVTQIVSVVCPKISSPSVSGFYKSTKGYNVTFTAFSSCSSGDILVSSEHCVEVPFSITTSPLQYTISCYSNNETVSDVLTAISTVSNSTISYTARLNFTTDFVNNSQDSVSSSQNGSPSESLNEKFKSFFLNGILGFYTGFKKFLNGLVNSIIMIIFTVLIMLLIYYSVKAFLMRKESGKGFHKMKDISYLKKKIKRVPKNKKQKGAI